MIGDKKVLAIIPARGGSKGVKEKNIKPLNGKPLIAYTIECALACKYIDKVIISTDSEDIARVSLELGAHVPFMRPEELATDTTPTLPVLQHAVTHLEEQNELYDIIVTLQPTSPLRKPHHIDKALDKLISTKCDSVVSISEVDYHPFWMKGLDEDRVIPFIEVDKQYTRRQDLPPIYKMNGAIFITEKTTLIQKNMILGLDTRGIVMDKLESVDIDTPMDFDIAEIILRRLEERYS